MDVQNGYENSLNDYVNKEKIAVDLINSIGSLMYEKGIELVLFRQHLVNINISELMNCFDYAKEVVNKPLDISLVNDLVKEIYKMDLAPSKLDIGKLTFEYTEQKNSFNSISEFLNNTLIDFIGQDKHTFSPQDVILYGFGRIGRIEFALTRPSCLEYEFRK